MPGIAGSGGSGDSDGKRLSNTAISKCSRGISVGSWAARRSGRVGQSGQAAAAGLYVRSWRSVAKVTHSPWVGS